MNEEYLIAKSPVRRIGDKNGDQLVLENSCVPVYIQDQTSEIIDLKLNQNLSSLTLTATFSIDDRVVTADVDPGFTPAAGDNVCIKSGTAFFQAEILSVVDNGGDNWSITVDTPSDYNFPIGAFCKISGSNLAVDGSTTPVIFRISPKNLTDGTRWDIVRLIFSIVDEDPMDDDTFGGLDALTNGIVLRKVDGSYKNIFNAKTNGDLAERMFDFRYSSKAPAGQYGLIAMRTFGGQGNTGVTVRLSTDDELQLIVQDDLTGLTRFRCIAQGHVVE